MSQGSQGLSSSPPCYTSTLGIYLAYLLIKGREETYVKKGKDYMHLHTYISLSVKMESTWKRVKTICTYKLIYRVTPKDKRITLTTTLKVTSSSNAISTLCASSPLSPIKSSPMTLHVMLMTPALTSVQIKNKKTKKN